jgi:hypothetical protein
MSEEDDGFAHGIAVGIALAAIGVHLVLVAAGGDWSAVYRDMGSHQIPLLTRISLSSAWQLGVPLVGGLALGTLIVRRPRPIAIYIAVAAVLVVAAVITWWYPTAPLRELAGNVGP